MALVPTFQPVQPEWRGDTSSADMNTNFNQILYDLNTLFTECASLVLDINTLQSTFSNELNAMNARLYAVSGVISSYTASASGYKIIYQDFFLSDNIVYPNSLSPQNQCVVDNAYGIVYLPTNNTFSQVYSTNITNGQIQVSTGLQAAASPVSENNNLKVINTSELMAFDGNDQTVWERDIQYNRDYPATAVNCRLDVTLPSLSNPYVNRVGLKPYPEGTVDIVNVTYDTLNTQGNVIPNFPTNGIIQDASPTFFDCNNIQPTVFHVYLQQRNSNLVDGYKQFTYGLKEMAIENTTYSSTGQVGLMFNLNPWDSGSFARITSISTTPNYDNIQYKLSLYVSEAEFQANIPLWTSSSSPITSANPLNVSIYATTTIWILVELNQPTNDAGSPVLQNVTMTYTTTT